MLSAIRARPLLVASAAAMAGALLPFGAAERLPPAGAPLVVAAAAAAALLLLGAVGRIPLALLAASALAAGVASGAREAAAARAEGEAIESFRLGPPPDIAAAALHVESVEENPFRGRTALVGRARNGRGVLCLWAGLRPDGIGPGARIRATGRPFVPARQGNPGPVDESLALALRGASLVMDLRRWDNVEVTAPAPEGPAAWLDRLRCLGTRALADRLSRDTAPIAAALLFGVRGTVSERDRRIFEGTGTLHILAISGMHVVLLAGALHSALRLLGAGPRTSAALTLLFAAAYLPVAGGGAPIRRAVYSIGFYALALLRGRRPDAANAISGAALLIALADPGDVGSIGFRLSFGATASIAWLVPAWERRMGARHRLLSRFPLVRRERRLRLLLHGYLVRALPTAVAAWLATSALVADAFGRFNPWAVPANLAAGPLFSLALPLLAFAAPGVPLAAPLSEGTLRLALGILEPFAALPGSTLHVPRPSLAGLLLWLLGCILLRGRARSAAAAFALALLFWPRPPPEAGPAAFVLDVGHGQACLLRFPDGTDVLADAGSGSRPLPGARTVVPALRALGVRRLEAVICSHGDADHWNALPQVFRAFPVGRLLVGPDPPRPLLESARHLRIPCERLEAPATIHEAGGARLSLVAAADRAGALANDRSLALLFESGEASLLLPGDREEAGLRALLEAGLGPVRALLAPHHGGPNREAERFGAALVPEILVVSADAGFPDPRTLARYGAARVILTAEAGAVRLRLLPGGGVESSTFR